MLRMSEVYYIAAEAIYQQDLETAKKYLSHVKKTRGVITDLENVTKDNFINVLVNDAQREFFSPSDNKSANLSLSHLHNASLLFQQ